jgi:hypothetical protein
VQDWHSRLAAGQPVESPIPLVGKAAANRLFCLASCALQEFSNMGKSFVTMVGGGVDFQGREAVSHSFCSACQSRSSLAAAAFRGIFQYFTTFD